MLELFRAEWIKIAGNRWVSGCLIWIFPIAAAALVLVFGFILVVSPTARASFDDDGPARWTDNAVGVWNVPNNPLGRLILLAFTAVVFAGEYQWQTWKSILPRSHRPALILVKFFTLGVFVVIAFVVMSIVFTLGYGVLTQIAGTSYGPKITLDVASEFAEDYLIQASVTFTSTIIAAGYAALAAMVTRSILGGLVVSFGLTLLEATLIVALALIGWLLDIPRIVLLYRFTPTFNVLNVTSWINENTPSPLDIEVGGRTIEHSYSLEFSLIVLAAWVMGLITLTMVLFQRQDITS